EQPRIRYAIKIKNKKIGGEVSLADFIEVKGWKALGNKLSDQKLSDIEVLEAESDLEEEPLHPGDSVEFPIEGAEQGSLFD
ncbi:MAG: hypothetical protein ACKOAY_03450, partial [Haliscomenobacter sp.]